jgi:cysteine-rich repeat protein
MCGDAIVRNGEQCDDGNYEQGDGCDSNCKIESTEMAINEKGLPGNSCPKGCRWNRRVHDCRCAAGVQQQAREATS